MHLSYSQNCWLAESDRPGKCLSALGQSWTRSCDAVFAILSPLEAN